MLTVYHNKDICISDNERQKDIFIELEIEPLPVKEKTLNSRSLSGKKDLYLNHILRYKQENHYGQGLFFISNDKRTVSGTG